MGLLPIACNFRCRLGEIDLIMRDGDCLVFVEVRYRFSNRFTPAKLTVTAAKQRKIIRTAALFLAKHRGYDSFPVRFDVVAIDEDRTGEKAIDWIRDAFRPPDSSL